MDGAGPADGANERAAHSPLENRRTAAGFPHRPRTANHGLSHGNEGERLDVQRTIMPNAPRVVSPSARSASRATGSGTRTANLRHWARNVTTSPSWMRLSKGTQATWPRAPCTSRPIASNECPKMKVGLELFSDC